jgi:hypothetical protein
MIMISKHDREIVTESIRGGQIDGVMVSEANLVDEVLLTMHEKGVLEGIGKCIVDKRVRRAIPFHLVMTLGIGAKMKVATSLTDIPFAIQSAKTLGSLGYCMWDMERDMKTGLMDEGSIRKLVGKYEAQEWIEGYNRYVQEHALSVMGLEANIHILDVTKLEVNLDNPNYEGAEVSKEGEAAHRGYKLATLRGVCGDRGVIEEIRFGSIREHDFKLSAEMLKGTATLKDGDMLVMDRGFIDREMINHLKRERSVDLYIPLRKDMDAYEEAVKIAKAANQWSTHPNPKRKQQKIADVRDLGVFWQGREPGRDVELTGCVVWDQKKEEYHVFVTTDTQVSARQMIMTYELRPEIEEDYRQIKDFWNIEDFKSRKKNVIAFHIVCVLLGYLFFQLYAQTLKGEQWAGKSLPVALKKFKSPEPVSVIICVGLFFAIYPLLDIMQLYASLDPVVRARLDRVLAFV